ncbi:MAG: nickel pincer cofactor biosynthesis protein LarC [Promethearchaeati archaeon]
MKVLYIDTENSGISGDLFLSALLALIKNQNKLIAELEELKNYLPGVKRLNIKLIKIEVSGIIVNKLIIELEEKKNHRSALDLKKALKNFLDDKEFSEAAKKYAKDVLDSLIKAESSVHNKLEDNIHLHELSSVDTLIDILGVTKTLDILGAFRGDLSIYTSKLPLGGGNIEAAHGTLPIPAPATSKIIENSKLIVYLGPIDDELTTPTGVALLVNLNPKINKIEFNLKKVAYSTGEKVFDEFPNIFRILFGKKYLDSEFATHLIQYREKVSVIETNVDDVSGEIIGDFIEQMENKVLDIQVIHCLTKKNRPSYIIKILCDPENKFKIIEEILENLGTLGVRYYDIDRICVDREIKSLNIEIDNTIYSVRYKISFIIKENQKKIINIKPEYEDLKKLRDITNYSIKRLKSIILPKLMNDVYKDNDIG